MITLHYGEKTINIDENTKLLSPAAQRLLLDGKYTIETGISYSEDEKVRKAYYIGALYELFKVNYSEFPNAEIYTMLIIGYPIFMKPRQIQNVISYYYELKSKRNVFAPAR